MSKDITLQRLNVDTDHVMYTFFPVYGSSKDFYKHLTDSVNEVYNNTLISNLSEYRNNGSIKYTPRFMGEFDIDINKKKKGELEKVILDAFDDNPRRLVKLHEKVMNYDGSFEYDNIVKEELESLKDSYLSI